jgi:hypothetical protein
MLRAVTGSFSETVFNKAGVGGIDDCVVMNPLILHFSCFVLDMIILLLYSGV